MLNEKDILAKLQNGETPESIANELTKILNGGMALKKEQDARDKAKQMEAQKYEDFQAILDEMCDFLATYYNELYPDGIAVTAEEVLPTVDNMFKALGSLSALLDTRETELKPTPTPKTAVSQPTRSARTADAIVNDFLRKMGW